MAIATKTAKVERIEIQPPKFQHAIIPIRGTSPLVMNKFSAKARLQIRDTQEAGSTARSKKKREPKDFRGLYEGSIHRSDEGWAGIPAPAFRNAMIRACTLAGVMMTAAKMTIFVEADGFDVDDRTPLVHITKGKPRYFESPTRLANGTPDLHPRAMWEQGWEAEVRVRWDAEQMTKKDVVNLMYRAGQQVGILEGRPFSKNSCGMGWGLFEIIGEK